MLVTLIIQDADALDAVGEIGLRRTLTYCKTNGIPLSQPIPLDTEEYIPDINPISTCHYIWRTMIPNARNLYTKTAKDLVEDKIKILEDFVKENHKL
jgi:HD superfamily phosphodiesterase